MKRILLKRIYDNPAKNDGYRMLVDRLWPRGVSKEDALLDEWNKEIAPSEELRKWFDHKDERFEEFTAKYTDELDDKKDHVKHLVEILKDQQVCLLIGAKNKKSNHGIVLKNYLKNLSKYL